MCRRSHDVMGVSLIIGGIIMAEAISVMSSECHPLADGDFETCSIDGGSS